jgi:hypothetical protein
MYLEFRMMGKVQKPSDFECYTPPSEYFIFYKKLFPTEAKIIM